jgi:RHS repeat-associated protein
MLGRYVEAVRDVHTGQRMLVESQGVPVQVREGSTVSALDLRLRDDGTVFRPVAPAVPIVVAKDPSGGVSFPQAGFSIALQQAGHASGPRLTSAGAFFANVARATDLEESARPRGAGIALQLRSRESPERFVFSVSLPAGARLVRATTANPIPHDPPQALEVIQGSTPLGFIYPPDAFDATGAPVSSSLALVGGSVVVTVAHRTAATTYPVQLTSLVPQWGNCDVGVNTDGLKWTQYLLTAPYESNFGQATCNDAYYLGLYQSMPTDGGWYNFSYANYTWQADPVRYPGVFVNQFVWYTWSHTPYDSYVFTGLLHPGALASQGDSAWQTGPAGFFLINEGGAVFQASPYTATFGFSIIQGTACFGFPGARAGAALREGCDESQGEAQGTAALGLGAYSPNGFVQTGPNKATETADGFEVAIGEHDAPVLQAPGPPSQGWLNDHGDPHTISVTATDVGLGVKSIALTGAATGGGSQVNSCTGDIYRDPCPPSATTSFSYTVPEGDNLLNLQATDIVGLASALQTWDMKIDRAPPEFVELSGNLVDASRQDPPIFTLPVGQVNVRASDRPSGVQSISASIDCPGVSFPPTNQTNPSDGADLSATITLNSLACSRGEHTIEITASDRAGNSTSRKLIVDLEPQAGSQPYYDYLTQPLDDRTALSENIGTGSLSLTANDAQITGTAGLNLDVTRTYNAIDYAQLPAQNRADAQDISPGWRLSIGPDVHLSTQGTSNGDVRYYGPTGETYLFVPTSPGASTYQQPAGLPATLVQNPNQSFTMSFYLSKTTYQFDAATSNGTEMPLDAIQDANGNQITIAYVPGTCSTALGCEVQRIQGTQGQTLTFGYNNTGQLTDITDTSGRQWKYTYDANGNLFTYIDPTGAETVYHYDAAGLLEEIQDPNQHTTLIAYEPDGSRRVHAVTLPDQTTEGRTTTFTYLNNNTETQVQDPNSFTTTYQLDPLGRVLQTVNPDGFTTNTAWTDSSARTNALDSDPDAGASVATAYEASNAYLPTSAKSLAGASTRCTYPNSGPNQFVPATCTDDLGHTLTYTYDAADNLKTTSGTVDGQVQVPVNLSYNTDGTLSQSIDGNQHATTYQYGNGQLIATHPPAPLEGSTYTYDSAGRVLTSTDGAGRTTTYTYDGDDRILTTLASGGGLPGTTTVSYTYDANGNLKTLTDPHGTTVYSYDPANRLTSEQRPDDTTATYGYDKDSNLTALADGVNDQQTFIYDPADRLHMVTAATPAGPLTWSYDYEPQTAPANGTGAMVLAQTTITEPNGITQTDKFTHSQLTNISYRGVSGTLRDFTYDYSTPSLTNSNLIQSLTTQTRETTNYGYDTFNRLISATSAGRRAAQDFAYTYDAASNRTTQIANGTTTTYAYNAAEQLTSATTNGQTPRTFTYDPSGNQTTDSTGYDENYNQLNQTTSFTSLNDLLTPLTPTYTGTGQADRTSVNADVRSIQSVLGTTSLSNTSLLDLGLGGNNNTTPGQTQVIRDPAGGLLGLSITSQHLVPGTGTTTTNYTYATDIQGSVSALYDSNQIPQDSYTYDPYGNATSSTVNVPQPFAFQGQYQDTTGLYHMGERYYDPSIGRWTQRDPIGGGCTFAGDDPINVGDSSGTIPTPLPGGNGTFEETDYYKKNPWDCFGPYDTYVEYWGSNTERYPRIVRGHLHILYRKQFRYVVRSRRTKRICGEYFITVNEDVSLKPNPVPPPEWPAGPQQA